MDGLSELELVAQATQAERQLPPASKPTPNGINGINGVDPTVSNGNGDGDTGDHDEIDLDNLDLSSLSPEDLKLLEPIIAALRISDPDGDGNGEDLAELLAQMDAADNVADQLEGKLDKLLENLGNVEAEIGQEVAEAQGEGKASVAGAAVEGAVGKEADGLIPKEKADNEK